MIYKLSIILVLSSLVCCLGNPECGLKACSNLETVKKCGNVQECINKVWLTEKSSPLREDVCDTCIRMVKQARDVLESNDTRELIKEVFEGSCALLKIPQIVKYCDKFADEYAVELVAMLASQMDPDTVCTTARLCKTREVSKECFECQNFIHVAYALFEKMSVQDFQREMFKVCKDLSSYSDSCFYYTTIFSDYFVNQTKHALANRPCRALGVCPMKSVEAYLLSVPSSSEEDKKLLCSMCPSFAATISNLIKGIDSLEKFKEVVYNLCSSLSSDESRCQKSFDFHMEELYTYLSQYFEPETFCHSDFALCSEEKPDGFPNYPLLPATDNFPPGMSLIDIVRSSIPLEVVPMKSKSKTNKPKIDFGDVIEAAPVFVKANNIGVVHCKSCFKMFNSAHKLLTSEKDFVEEFAQSVCFSMPDSGSCFQLIELYLQSFINKFDNMYDASKVCPQLISDCSAEQQSSFMGDVCVDCIKTVDFLKEGLHGDFARNELIESASAVCLSVPNEWQSICHQFVNSTLTKVVNLLEKSSGNETCSALKMCKASQAPTASKGSCKVCMLVIQTIYDQMKDPQNKEQVEKILETVCSTLPPHLKDKCDEVVQTYTDEIVSMILQNLKPSDVCRRINFCPKSLITSTIRPVSKSQVDVTKPKIPCSFCISTVNTLLEELGNEKTEDQIKQLMDKLCTVMPNEIQDTCKALVSQFSDQIIDMIIADFNAQEICTFLKICGPKISDFSLKVLTNEVSAAYNPSAACEFCRFLQFSLNAKENKTKTAETMLAFLEDVCLMDRSDTFTVCKNKTSEILPKGKLALMQTENICDEFEICLPKKAGDLSTALENMHAAVQECAMCEFIVGIISKHDKMLDSEYDFTKSAPAVCAAVPADRISMCHNLIISYGPSVVNLITNSHVNSEKVCGYMNLCDERQQVKLGMPVSEKEPKIPITKSCLEGPDFWCKNEANARLCGTYLHCQEAVWKNGVPPSVNV